MDLCLDSISGLNRIQKQDLDITPYETFTGKYIDFIRDFHVEWGELVVVKKPKGISSDLGVTGQWAVVTRRMMNGTGVIKVYLVQSEKYAYCLRFTCTRALEWLLEALKEINPEATIGFEDGSTTEDIQLHQSIKGIENQQYSIIEDEENELKDLDDEVCFIGDNE